MDFAAVVQQFFAQGSVLQVPVGLDYFSVMVGVLTGALFACERRLDVIGTVVAGLLTGYGGGIVRDLLMQDHGVYFMSDPDLIVLCIAICVFVFYFRGVFKRLEATVFFADALSVALFALAGASKAFACNQGIVLSVILGGITAVGGGALRDIAVGETPSIFKQSNFYAVAGLCGSASYVLMAVVDWPLAVAATLSVSITIFMRYWSVVLDWKTQAEADLTPHVVSGIGKLRRVLRGLFLAGGDALGKAKRGNH